MRPDKFYRNLCVTLLVMVAIVVVYKARDLLTPVVTALVIAYVLYPMVDKAARLGFPKGILISLILFVTFGSVFFGMYKVVPAVKSEIVSLTAQSGENSRLIKICMKVSAQLRDYGVLKKEVDSEKIAMVMKKEIETHSTGVINSLGGLAKKTFQFLMVFFFVLVFALKDGDKLQKTIVANIPNSVFEPGLFMLKKTTDLLGYYLRGLVIENVILGFIAFILLLVLSYFTPLTVVLSLLIAAIIAFTNVIRIVGPVIGGAIGVLLVLTTSADFPAMLGVIVVALIVQLLDNVLVLPLVMQDQMDLHPVICLLSVLSGGILAGVLGMMLAIPIAGGIKVVYLISTVEMKKFNMDPGMIR